MCAVIVERKLLVCKYEHTSLVRPQLNVCKPLESWPVEEICTTFVFCFYFYFILSQISRLQISHKAFPILFLVTLLCAHNFQPTMVSNIEHGPLVG